MGGNVFTRLCLASLLALGLCAVAARAQTSDGLPDPGAEPRGWRCTSDLMQIGPGPSS